jgi:DNA-binding SARP family transcriptional activator
LAVEREAVREKAANLLWSDLGDRKARHALNQTVFELRKMLGEDWVQTKGNELQVAPSVQVDLLVFNEAVERADFRVALEVYRGAFLQGGPVVDSQPFEEWTDQKALKSRRTWVRAACMYIDQRMEAGDLETALQCARRAVELEPQEDELQHLLISLLHRAGRRIEALEQYAL